MNRQVPRDHLIIGNGRLAAHLRNYFSLEHLPFLSWQRDSQTPEELQQLLKKKPLCLLAISDRNIESFITENNLPPDSTIHFSGSLCTQKAMQFHPLMTFSKDLYTLDTYRSIPFVSTSDQQWSDYLPGMTNKTYQISAEQTDLYHAFCVLSGNGTILLWQKIIDSFEKDLNLPQTVLKPYLKQTMENLLSSEKDSLTGPWVRNDKTTIHKNINALTTTNYNDLYKSFLSLYQKGETA